MILPKNSPQIGLISLKDFDENTFVFSKYYGEDTAKWKCINSDCKSPSIIEGIELKVMDESGFVSWERYGPLAMMVFPLCHHCGCSLGQIYTPIKPKNRRNRVH